MSQIVTWQHPLLLQWLETEIKSEVPRPATTLALFKDREPLAIVGYFNCDGISIEGAIAASNPRHWANKTFVRAALAYPFKQLGCRRFVVRVEDGNDVALAFDKRLGFVHEGTLRKASGNGRDVHILAMLDTEYRASRWYFDDVRQVA
jgi:RimJ/RimL family protein N-acetyltransferase